MGPQQLPRAAAAASLIASACCSELAAACAWPPLRGGERVQIAAISAQPDRWYIFCAVHLAQLDHARACRARPDAPARPQLRPVWALIAGSLAGLGILIGIGDLGRTQLVFTGRWAPPAAPASARMAALATALHLRAGRGC